MTELIKITPEAIEKYRQSNHLEFLETIRPIADSGKDNEINDLILKEYNEFIRSYPVQEFPSLSDLSIIDFAETFLYVNKDTILEYLGVHKPSR